MDFGLPSRCQRHTGKIPVQILVVAKLNETIKHLFDDMKPYSDFLHGKAIKLNIEVQIPSSIALIKVQNKSGLNS